MLRSMFFAIGTFVTLAGLLLFRVDRIVLTPGSNRGAAQLISSPLADGCREIDPPAWLSYTLASCGVLTMLYAFALPKKGT
jgi:hypothetical protein